MNFAEYFTFDNYKEFNEINHKIHNEPDLPKNYANLYDRLFGTAILKFIKDYDTKYGFPAIENGEGHITHIQACLEKFLKGEELIGYQQREIPMLFYKVVSEGMYNFNKEEETEDYLKSKYDVLIEKFNKGTFKKYELSEDSCKCYDCDQHFKMTMENWKPIFNNLEFSKGYSSTLVKPEPCINKEAIELSVNFTKGDLLISDWFNIPEFTKSFKNDFEINSIKGRIESTKHHLETGNVLHLVLGNCSPGIFVKDDNLIFGRENEDMDVSNKGYIQKGRVCTELWAATIVEKDQLVDIIVNKLFKDNNNQGSKDDYKVHAQQKVENYLLENKFNITKIKVKPGQYKLKFHGNYNKFSEKSENEDIPLNIKPYFTIEQSVLEKIAKPKKNI